MYLKIVNSGQLNLLRSLNKYLGKRKLPEGILGLIRRILDKEKLEFNDYIALFFKPIKNDTIGLYDALQIYPYTIDTEEKDYEDVRDKKDSKYSWSCYMIRLKESNARIFLIYSMKKKDIRRGNDL